MDTHWIVIGLSSVVIGRLIRLVLQWRGRLHSYMWGWMGWDVIGWMVIIGRRQSKSTKSNNFVKPIRDIHCDTNLVFFLIVQRGGGVSSPC